MSTSSAPLPDAASANNFLALHRDPAQWTEASLAALSHTEFLALFARLPAPGLAELDGEYDAILADQGSALMTWLGRRAIDLRGRWLGKAFAPLDEVQGQGYNRFQQGSQLRRKYRMSTCITASQQDGAPCLQLDYRPFKSLFGRLAMVDELRRVRSGLYIGLGSYSLGKRHRSGPLPFILSGPVASFVGADNSEI